MAFIKAILDCTQAVLAFPSPYTVGVLSLRPTYHAREVWRSLHRLIQTYYRQEVVGKVSSLILSVCGTGGSLLMLGYLKKQIEVQSIGSVRFDVP